MRGCTIIPLLNDILNVFDESPTEIQEDKKFYCMKLGGLGGGGGEGAGPKCRHGQEPEVNLKGLLKEMKITAMLAKTRN